MAKSGPKKERPKPIVIVSVKRTRKTIAIAWTQGDAAFDLEERDNPLPAFTKAMDALTPIVGTICHLPKAWTDTGVVVKGFKMGEQGGTPTVSLTARKDIDDAAKEFAFKTPERLLAHPTQPGKYTPPLDAAEAELVQEAIEEAKRYVKGERAQGQIEFEGEDEDGPLEGEADETAPLPLLPTDAPKTPRKPKRDPKMAAANDDIAD